MKKFILILIASIGISFYLSAQSIGDYSSIGSGNWNDPTKWQIFNGSSWVSTTTYPGQNSGTGAVTIKIFHELKLTATVPSPIASLLIEQMYDYPAEGVIVSQNGIVVFSSENSVSLRVSGDVAIHGELRIDDQNDTKTHTLFIGAYFEIGTPIYDIGCGGEMIPATFQTINQDDKLGVVFTGSTWINTGPNGITFQDVTFDGTGFSVTYPVYIKGTATFINGIVGISNNLHGGQNCTLASGFNGDMVFYDGSTVSGASNASFVQGWPVSKLGDDPFTFPIGEGNVYAPLTISAPASQSATVVAYYQRINPTSWGPITDPGLFNISNCEVWNLDSEPNNNLDVTVSWSAASGCEFSPYIANVSEVTLARLGQGGWSSHGGSGIGTTTNGSVTMSGVNSYGAFTLGNLGACNAPGDRTVTNISSTSATLNWSAANGAISYDVDYKPYSGEWINAATATTSTSVNISGLLSGLTCSWRIRTNCSSSSSLYLESHFVTLCAAPLGLSTTNITISSATLNWLAVSPGNYRVEYKQSASTTWLRGATNTQSLSYTLAGLTANTAYDWRVVSICNMSIANSAQSSFTTLQAPPPPPPPPPVCKDVYETNNVSSQARAISLGNTISAGISSAADVDWFKVTTPNNSNTNLEVTLSSLPADYDLYVYNKNLQSVGSSVNAGTANEVVIYNSNARKATYYIKVVGKNGAYNTSQCYTLLAQVSSSARSASGKSDPANEVNDISNKQLLYPNPASEFVMLEFNSTQEGPVNVQIFNTTGQLVRQSAIEISKGNNQVKIVVNDIKEGMYLLRINKGELSMTRKFVITR